MTFTLAHLSDPHLAPMPRLRLRDLAGKRALGLANWRGGRQAGHQPGTLARVIAHLKAAAPDHIALTGDLVNIALASEFEGALAWLSTLGEPADVSVVPGNHDAYVAGALKRALGAWGGYVSGDGAKSGAFPYIRRRGPLGIVGLSSAVATGPFLATGFVGAEQIIRMQEALVRLREEGRFRVVLIHHPPLSGLAHWSKRLVDRKAVSRAIAAAGAELVLHGHTHRSTLHRLESPSGPIPVVGVASASAAGPLVPEHAAYNLFEISGAVGQWRVWLRTFALSQAASIVAVRSLDPLACRL